MQGTSYAPQVVRVSASFAEADAFWLVLFVVFPFTFLLGLCSGGVRRSICWYSRGIIMENRRWLLRGYSVESGDAWSLQRGSLTQLLPTTSHANGQHRHVQLLRYHVVCVADAPRGIVVGAYHLKFVQESFCFYSRDKTIYGIALVLFHQVETCLVNLWVCLLNCNWFHMCYLFSLQAYWWRVSRASSSCCCCWLLGLVVVVWVLVLCLQQRKKFWDLLWSCHLRSRFEPPDWELIDEIGNSFLYKSNTYICLFYLQRHIKIRLRRKCT